MNCRLCNNSDFTIDMFSDAADDQLKRWRFYALMATGIEIREDDLASKAMCPNCCGIVEKIYKYRANAVAHDKLLRERLGEGHVPSISDLVAVHSSAEISASSTNTITLTPPRPKKPTSCSKTSAKLLNKHDSVNQLFNKYPSIILPEELYGTDVNPDVTLDECEVKDWFEDYLKRFKQKLSLTNITIKKVSDCEKKCTSYETKISLPIKTNKECKTSLPSEHNLKITTITLPLQKHLLLATPVPSSKSTVYNRSCPKPKKVQTAPEDVTVSINNNPPLDSSKTQINHISTTTDTVVPKKKRKPRRQYFSTDCASDEVIPEKKRRIYASPTKLDVIERLPSSTIENRELPAPSLGLVDGTEPPDIEDYPCQICPKVFGTNQELHIHQKRHLTCKFCKGCLSSYTQLQVHEKQGCHVKIKQNPPKLDLPRVDEIKSIVSKFSSAFETDVVYVYDSDDDDQPQKSASNLNNTNGNSEMQKGLPLSSTPSVSGILEARLRSVISTQYNMPVAAGNYRRQSPITPDDSSMRSRAANILRQKNMAETTQINLSNAESIEQRSLPITPDHLPYTTFYYAPATMGTGQMQNSIEQTQHSANSVRTTHAFMPWYPAPPSNLERRSSEYTKIIPPNKTVYEIPSPNQTSSYQRFPTAHSDTLPTFQTNLASNEEWQPGIGQESQVTCEVLGNVSLNELEHTSGRLPIRMTSHMEYQAPPVDQTVNYYKRHGYSSENGTNNIPVGYAQYPTTHANYTDQTRVGPYPIYYPSAISSMEPNASYQQAYSSYLSGPTGNQGTNDTTHTTFGRTMNQAKYKSMQAGSNQSQLPKKPPSKAKSRVRKPTQTVRNFIEANRVKSGNSTNRTSPPYNHSLGTANNVGMTKATDQNPHKGCLRLKQTWELC